MANTGVKGKIINAKTHQGYGGLKVTVVDFDPIFQEDDVLGNGETNTQGEFSISYTQDKYRDWINDRNPDIVVRIFNKFGRLLHETKEVEDVADNILITEDISIHPTSVEGWLVNHTTLNPANPDPVFLYKGNKITHLIDGDKMFPAVTEAAKSATKSINLMQLFFDVNNGLITEFKSESEFDPLNPPTSDCKSSMAATLEDVLKAKDADVAINVMVTDIPLSASDTVSAVKKFFDGTNVKTAAFQKGFAVLHSKAIIFDGVKAILMGSPLKQYYFSGQDHAIRDARHKGSLNHDANVQIEGPAVEHISRTFATVWKSTEKPLTMPPQGSIPEISGGVDSNVASVQILRTLPAADYKPTAAGDEDIPNGETGILEAYQRAIENAQRFVYIENQYFTCPDIIDALSFRMKDDSKPKLEIILLLNMKPDLPGYPDRQVDNVNMLKILADSHHHKLGVYTRWSRSKLPGDEKFTIMPVYVHAKLAVIDDTWATVGSANLDGTSMNYHEIGLMFTGAVLDAYLSKVKPGEDFGKYIWDMFWYVFMYVVKPIIWDYKFYIAFVVIVIKLIKDFDETMNLIRETMKDIPDIPGIVSEVLTRTSQHVLPNRDHQPSRSIEMNVVMYSGIADQPKNETAHQLRQILWEEHLGINLPDNIINSPASSGELNYVKFWDEQANKNKEAMKAGTLLLDAPAILPWQPESDSKKYAHALGIRNGFLRLKAPAFSFKECKFDDGKSFLPWPII
ncbi:MAG: phospholipase D family protein [Chryseolinea sp.]